MPPKSPRPARQDNGAASGPDGAQLEIALLRDQLQALTELHLPADGALTQERDLLRDQLANLLPLLGKGVHRDTPGAGEETLLLRDLLSLALQGGPQDRPAPAPAPPQPVTPGMAVIEAALARLLAELVQETDRRIRAEAEATQARAQLRHHGLDASPPPARIAVAARRLA